MPALADTAVEMATTSGMASPRAWGQAMTNTVTAAVRAVSQVAERAHTTNVTRPEPVAM